MTPQVQQEPEAVVVEAVEAVRETLDLLIWNGAVKWGAGGEQLVMFRMVGRMEVSGGW